MSVSKKVVQYRITTPLNKTAKKARLMASETIQLPIINYDQLQTKRLGFGNHPNTSRLNLARFKVDDSRKKLPTSNQLQTERTKTGSCSHINSTSVSRDKTNSQIKPGMLDAPSISMRISQVSTDRVKRRRNSTHCKILVPKNCPFPFSNKVKRAKVLTQQQEQILQIGLNISRINGRSSYGNDQNIEGLFSKDSIQEIPIF